jgi:hypothetical protein
MAEPTEAEIAWVAGIFEGEGCICDCGVRSVSLTISSTDRDVLEEVQRIMGTGGIHSILRSEVDRQNRKPIFQWHIANRDDVRLVLESLLPWLRKRRYARALEALKRLELNQGLNGKKTHCKYGHPLSGENLYVRQGKRGCITCRRRLRMESYWRVKARRAETFRST